MKRLIIFVDLFSLLAVALFVAFSASVGSGGVNEESSNLVVIELRPQLRAGGGSPVSAFGKIDYGVRIVTEAGETTVPTTVVTQDYRDSRRIILRNPPKIGKVEIDITMVDPSAFDFDRHRVTIARTYPSSAVEAGTWEPIGAAGEYSMDLK